MSQTTSTTQHSAENNTSLQNIASVRSSKVILLSPAKNTSNLNLSGLESTLNSKKIFRKNKLFLLLDD